MSKGSQNGLALINMYHVKLAAPLITIKAKTKGHATFVLKRARE